MRFLLIFLLISTTAFAKDKIYTCKPVAAAVVMESGQTYSETLDTMDEEAALLSVVPTSQFVISEEEGFFYKNNPSRNFESLLNFSIAPFSSKNTNELSLPINKSGLIKSKFLIFLNLNFDIFLKLLSKFM